MTVKVLDSRTPLPAGTLALVSWTRQGLAGRLMTTSGAITKSGRMQLPVPVQMASGADVGNLSTSAIPDAPIAMFHGPADVAGIDSRQIIRTDPTPLATDFEPNFLPLVEFDRPDLPWLFSPSPPDDKGRWHPWLTLIVLPKSIAQVQPSKDAAQSLPTIECPLAELPPLAEAWAWAHSQVIQGSAGGVLIDGLADDARSLSRLIAARRLDPIKTYVACVVPTYRLGRRAGLGETMTAAEQVAQGADPAWDVLTPANASDVVRLPVYFDWEFSTGAAGDFEALASLLKVKPPTAGVGVKPIDATAPGWTVPSASADTLPMRGALRPIDMPEPNWIESDAFRKQLLRVLNSEADVAPTAGGAQPALPLIGPPIYGQAWPQASAVDPASSPPWLSDVNLHVERRIAAGLGAMVVRFEQEPMMAAAWDQLAAWTAQRAADARRDLAQAVQVKLSMPSDDVAGRVVNSLAASTTMRRIARRAPPETRRPAESLAHVTAMLSAARSQSISPPQQLPSARRASRQALAAPAAEESFSPSFATPTSELLVDYFPDFFLPGLQSIEVNSIALLRVDDSFVEAFMLGLNHEFGREMRWRGYAADARGTPFRQFWDRRASATANTNESADMQEIAQWPADSALGTHLKRVADPALLLIRGDLLRRFPRAAVFAEKAIWKQGIRVRSGLRSQPLFLMPVPPDITLVAFDIPQGDIRGGDIGSDGDAAGWFFVLQELPGSPRFGLDIATHHFGGNPTTWRDLSWSDVASSKEVLDALRYLPLAAARGDGSVPSVNLNAATVWAASSADMASIARRLPFELVIHGRVWFEQ